MANARVLILIPHPDDEVVGCLSPILRAQEEGKKIFGLHLTTGVYLQKGYEKRVSRRREEAKAVARLLKIEGVSFEEIPSRHLKENLFPIRKKILGILQEEKIDEVWTPAYEGGHQDHDVTNFLASILPPPISVFEFSEYHFFQGKRQSNSFFHRQGTEKFFQLSSEERAVKKKGLSLYRSEWFNLKIVAPSLTQEMLRPLAPYDYSHPPYDGKMLYQRFQRFAFHPKVDSIQPQELCTLFKNYMTQLPSKK